MFFFYNLCFAFLDGIDVSFALLVTFAVTSLLCKALFWFTVLAGIVADFADLLGVAVENIILERINSLYLVILLHVSLSLNVLLSKVHFWKTLVCVVVSFTVKAVVVVGFSELEKCIFVFCCIKCFC